MKKSLAIARMMPQTSCVDSLNRCTLWYLNMEQQSSQPDLAELLRRGDPAAGALLVQRYAERLIALARQHLDRRLRGKVDPEDVEQSVLRSFFRRHAAGEWDITDESSLWPLLLRITLRKCQRRLEHFLAARRDVRREAEDAEIEQPAIDPEPTPEEAVLFAEAAETVMSRLGSEMKRNVFRLSLQGYNIVEISEQLRYYERGVERVRAEIRTLLQTMMTDDLPAHG
jgi:DNA-directed RNA polymerase specialized sigma24 family protein